jgi:ubiquinone/menaquinone biosynthesis C-methylase UbiE
MSTPLLLKLTNPVHARLRAGRSQMAVDIMKPAQSMSLLDVGGSPGIAGEWDRLRVLFERVVVVNRDPDCNTRKKAASNVTVEIADGCALPYPDRSFDWVFSNAVLEHVGDRTKQDQFSKEMQRVARVGYFLSTPNKHFFLDPHTYLPFYHLLPKRMQEIAIHFSVGHMRSWEPLNLVSARELREMFPAAHIEAAGPFGLNLIAYGRC